MYTAFSACPTSISGKASAHGQLVLLEMPKLTVTISISCEILPIITGLNGVDLLVV
jgi:hypothetical protein